MAKSYSRLSPVSKEAEALGNFLYRFRQKEDLTQEDVRKRTGISLNSIYTYERGLRFPTMVVLIALSRGLGVKMEEIGRAIDDVPVEKTE